MSRAQHLQRPLPLVAVRLRDQFFHPLRRLRLALRDAEKKIHENRPQRKNLAQQHRLRRPNAVRLSPRKLPPHPLQERQILRPRPLLKRRVLGIGDLRSYRFCPQ